MKLNNRFKQLLSNIEPDGKNVTAAKSEHEKLRKALQDDSEFGATIVQTFLAGSYARDTAVKPIKDVDIFVIVTEESYAKVKPQKVFDDLTAALGRIGYGFKTEKQRRSVRIELTEVDLDVVVSRAPNGTDAELLIPDRSLGEWIPTNPKEHTTWVSRFNGDQKGSDGQGRFVPLVKLMKAWKRHFLAGLKRPKGFTLECITGINFGGAHEEWADVFVAALKQIYENYRNSLLAEQLPAIPDPGRPGHYLSTSLTFAQFRDFIDGVERAVKIAEEAIASDDEAESTRLWRRLFGEDFPEGASGKAKEAAVVSAPSFARVSNVRESPPFA